MPMPVEAAKVFPVWRRSWKCTPSSPAARVLPLLSTYLPLPEIGEQLFLSPNTIKSHARSIYRKLGATTRSEAVRRAREVGLLDG